VTAIKNNRGSALLEAAPVMLVLMLFALGLLLAAYLFLARAWIQYQSEQALYCVAEGRASFQCKSKLEEKLKQFLPWGEGSVQLHAFQDQWTVEVLWRNRDYRFRLYKELSPKAILAAKALQW
jgi:hypothetical protein